MTDLNNNAKKFNIPNYINSPFFLYQDSRLDKPALLIASFFYSLHTAGQKLTASTDYLCQLALIKKRQLYNIMNQLEEYQYIKRTGFTNRKKLEWIYDPKSSITIVEKETNAIQCTSVEDLNTSALQCTKLVHSSALNYCTPVHTYNKEDNKEDTTTTGDQILTKDFPLEPVVVFSSSSLTPDEKKSTKFLTSLYEENHFVTNNILGLEDFLSAAYWLIKNRGEILLYKRHAGIKTLVESGRFEGDEEWIKLRTKERNRKIGDEKQKIIEQKMKEKAPISNKSNNINSSKCLSSLLSELTGKENYKESKIMESEKQKKQKKEIEKNLVKPINGFTRIRLPEELGSSIHANQQGKSANIC